MSSTSQHISGSDTLAICDWSNPAIQYLSQLIFWMFWRWSQQIIGRDAQHTLDRSAGPPCPCWHSTRSQFRMTSYLDVFRPGDKAWALLTAATLPYFDAGSVTMKMWLDGSQKAQTLWKIHRANQINHSYETTGPKVLLWIYSQSIEPSFQNKCWQRVFLQTTVFVGTNTSWIKSSLNRKRRNLNVIRLAL